MVDYNYDLSFNYGNYFRFIPARVFIEKFEGQSWALKPFVVSHFVKLDKILKQVIFLSLVLMVAIMNA